GGRSDGVCERNKQTEHPWSACKKAPSVAVTWGWGSHDLLADLGNNAVITAAVGLFSFIEFIRSSLHSCQPRLNSNSDPDHI
ncbi:MAG: hypothetical protein ACRC5V_07695, partial [Aeromonas sp.]